MKNSQPYFSVCIETNNRSATILRTLNSVFNQSFRDFELILFDNLSDDNTYEIISNFFNSDKFKSNPFRYLLKRADEKIHNKLECWNKPLNYASGRFIAVLEGDDEFLNDHLLLAHDILSNEENIGLYVSKNYNSISSKPELKNSESFFIDIFNIKGVAAPSQAIFIREHNGKSFRYNTKDYSYAPEIDLYLQIANFNFQAYYSDNKTIKRDIEGVPKPIKWQSSKDRFTLIKLWNSYSKKITKSLYKKAWNNTCNITFSRYIHLRVHGLDSNLMWAVLKEEVINVDFFKYFRFLILKNFVDIFTSIKLMKIYLNLRKYFK